MHISVILSDVGISEFPGLGDNLPILPLDQARQYTNTFTLSVGTFTNWTGLRRSSTLKETDGLTILIEVPKGTTTEGVKRLNCIPNTLKFVADYIGLYVDGRWQHLKFDPDRVPLEATAPY